MVRPCAVRTFIYWSFVRKNTKHIYTRVARKRKGLESIMCSVCKWRDGEWWVMISTMIFPNSFASCAACSLWIPDELFVLFGKRKCGKKGRAWIWSMLKNQKIYHSLNFIVKNIKKKKLNSIIFFPNSEIKLLWQITTSFEFNVAITRELSKLSKNVARGASHVKSVRVVASQDLHLQLIVIE